MISMAGKVFLACALGGGVGALVALQMWQPLWWVGMLVGGLIGYLTYEFDEVRRAVPLAWRKATGWRWCPDWKWWRVFLRLLPRTAMGEQSIIILPFLLFLWALDPKNVTGFIVVGGFFSFFLVLRTVVATFVDTGKVMCGTTTMLAVIQDYWTVNVFRMYFWVVPRAMLKGVRLIATMGPGLIVKGAVTVARFFWYLFILIHSEVRLLCGLDAAFGAAVGFYFGNAIVGALAGGMFGVINYEVVSKRWLKLVPARAR